MENHLSHCIHSGGSAQVYTERRSTDCVTEKKNKQKKCKHQKLDLLSASVISRRVHPE